MTKSPNPTERRLYTAQLLAVLAHRKQHADHPAFPRDAYPTTVEEVVSVWAAVVEHGYAELVKHPCLAVRITAAGEKVLSSYVCRRKNS